MKRDASKDFLIAFGAVMGIVSVWQYVEAAKMQKKANAAQKDLIKRLTSIEKKLA